MFQAQDMKGMLQAYLGLMDLRRYWGKEKPQRHKPLSSQCLPECISLLSLMFHVATPTMQSNLPLLERKCFSTFLLSSSFAFCSLCYK
ncbi:similar to Tripartite motif protein 30-like (predicted), isoform CRA_b [Rattus norvegicus]|uniref:Similar to Tripartite motif protein 30-like (Predicted), isoform CRA_b n=1 Tax=Rattus norvegicus TaxID=10116 RepID=A6I7F0_RAT|nr:similar to Tripartite motif protein 30-like (predicted), isoform CRA_b [Rattus norvegicus]